MTARYAGHAPIEFNKTILSYPSITQIMVDSHCEILWSDNSGADLGSHLTANYAAVLENAAKQAVIAQHYLRSKMLCIWIKKSLTTNANRKLRALKYAYNFNAQDDGATMLFVTVKMVRLDTRTGCSDIKSKPENTKMPHLKNDTPKTNLHISEWMNDISIAGGKYSEIARQIFTLYSTSSCQLFKDYM